MKIIENQYFEGERPLYCEADLVLRNVTIGAGESALKETRNITAENCSFDGKYPFWICDGFKINNCTFKPGARAALWYSKGLQMTDTVIDAPKMFRDSENLNLQNVKFSDAQETFWYCKDISLKNCEINNAPYLFMHSQNIEITDYKHNGNYGFQYCKNIVIRNAELNTKDAFWNSENVEIYDSKIVGEYLAWHSKNVKLVNCVISETQPLCYADNLQLINCTFTNDADLAFEYSDVNADINGSITSVKNPKSGHITADSIGEIILDSHIKQPANCIITQRKDNI